MASAAGIWRWSEGQPRFAFLTCEPNPLVAPLHEKAMPVILQPEDYDRWLDGEVEDAVRVERVPDPALRAVVEGEAQLLAALPDHLARRRRLLGRRAEDADDRLSSSVNQGR